MNYREVKDEVLVAESLKDSNIFGTLMSRYEKKLLRYIFRLSSLNTELAEDILQDVFIKVYRNLNGFDKSYSFSSWIYRITHNEVISAIRKIKARPVVVTMEGTEVKDLIELIPSKIDFKKDLEKKELAKKVKKIIAELPVNYRDVLILRFLEDKDYNEMSDILEKPIGTVSVWLNRAKDQFKKSWEIIENC